MRKAVGSVRRLCLARSLLLLLLILICQKVGV